MSILRRFEYPLYPLLEKVEQKIISTLSTFGKSGAKNNIHIIHF
jgi:hypothetical protein